MESERSITSDDEVTTPETKIELNDGDASENLDPDPLNSDSQVASTFVPEVEATCRDKVMYWLRNISVTSPILGVRHPNFTWLTIFHWVTNVASGLLSWALLYFLFGDLAAPRGAIFTLLLLIVAAYCLGWGLTHVPYLHLPPVFGMLVAGVIARNSGLYNIRDTMSPKAMGAIRNFCLTFVMVRSGIQLNTTPLRSHPMFLMILALVPCTLEMFVVTFCFKGLLGFPWDWAFLGGCVIACMSPVVTVNCLLALADQGYGEDKDISGLLCAACSIDGVHIMAVFSIAFSVVFDDSATNQWWAYLPRGLRDLAFGIILGTSLGLFFVFFPHQSSKYATWYRTINLFLGALCFSLGASTFLITGGGFLATVFMGFVACTGWKVLVEKFDVTQIRRVTGIIWHLLQPVLCSVIGADVNFSHWTLSRTALHAFCILIGLAVRLGSAVLSTLKMPFTIGERIFVALSWLPKGTVQAALAPMAYEHALAKNNTAEIDLAEDVVKISVMAIVILAPFGAMIMMVTGPRLLNRISSHAIEERRLQSLRVLTMKVKSPRKRKNRLDQIDETQE